MRLSASRLFRLTILVFIILMLLSLPLRPYTSAEPCAILKVSLPDGAYAGSSVDPWLNECWLLNLTGFSQTFTVRINNTNAVKRSYDTRLVIALNDVGYTSLQSLIVNGTSVPKAAFEFEKPQPYGLWEWPSGDVYPTWFEDTYVNVGTIFRKNYKSVVVSVVFSNATGAMMHFDAYGSRVSGPPCYSGYITHNGISEDSTVLFSAGQPGNQPPTANFFYTPSYPTSHENVAFNASASYDPDGYITSYRWDFGDETPIVVESDPTVDHTYADYGNYTVKLTVTDDDGLTDDSTLPIRVRQSPLAAFTYSPLEPHVHQEVAFNASESKAYGGVIVSYEWDFGDGTPIITESDPITTHHYTQSGSFIVTLNVTDSEDLWDLESKIVAVSCRTNYLAVKTSPEGIVTIPGEGFYANGTYVNLDAPAYAPSESGDGGRRYMFDYWDVDGTAVAGNPIGVLMTANHTATAHYVIQYLVSFTQVGLDYTANNAVATVNGEPKGFNDMPFLLWADASSSVTYEYSTVISSTTAGKQFTLEHIGGPISPFTVTKPETIIGSYGVQYYLTLTVTVGGTTDPPSGGWYDAGTPVSVLAVPNPDYVLDHWELDGTPSGSNNPYSVLMSSAHILHAAFVYSPPPPSRYYLTVRTAPLGVTLIPGEGFYDEGSDVVLAATNNVDVSSGSRYRFDFWDVDGVPRDAGTTSITIRMEANHTATAHYTLQYYLAITSLYDTPTPASGWFNAGVTITASVTSPWAGTKGTRYLCTGWTGTGSVPGSGTTATVTFMMSAPSSITWKWKTQHYLTVKVKPPGGMIVTIPGEGWYDASTVVPLTAPRVSDYEFRYWDVDGVLQGNGTASITVKMDAPHTATATYQPLTVGGASAAIEPPSLVAWAGISSMLAATLMSAGFWKKRQQQKDN